MRISQNAPVPVPLFHILQHLGHFPYLFFRAADGKCRATDKNKRNHHSDHGRDFNRHSSHLLTKTIAHTFHRLYIFRGFRTIFHLFPQSADDGHNIAVVINIFLSPNILVYLLLCQNFPLIFRKEQKQVKFLWRQLKIALCRGNRPVVKIDFQTVKTENLGIPLFDIKTGIAPDQGKDPGDQLV